MTAMGGKLGSPNKMKKKKGERQWEKEKHLRYRNTQVPGAQKNYGNQILLGKRKDGIDPVS